MSDRQRHLRAVPGPNSSEAEGGVVLPATWTARQLVVDESAAISTGRPGSSVQPSGDESLGAAGDPDRSGVPRGGDRSTAAGPVGGGRGRRRWRVLAWVWRRVLGVAVAMWSLAVQGRVVYRELVRTAPAGARAVAVSTVRAMVHYDGWLAARRLAADAPVTGRTVRFQWMTEAAVRSAVATVAAAVAVAVGWWMVWPLGWSTLVAITAGVVAAGVLGAVGRPPDAPPLFEPVFAVGPVGRLDEPTILAAVARVIPGVDQSTEDKAARLVAPGLVKVTGDNPGAEAVIDLPEGGLAGQVIERRRSLASALRLPEDCVWPEAVKASHPGRFRLFISEVPLGAADVVAWPLLRAGTVNVFTGFPIGQDQRGQWIPLRVVTQGGIIAAKPRMGKTFLLRVISGGLSLDPRVELWVYDAKGSPDLLDLERVAYRFGSTNDEDVLAPQVAAELADLKQRMAARYATMTDLKRRGESTSTQITDELAATRDLDLHPIVVVIDECHELFAHPVHGAEIEALTATLAKRGPAVGISILVATQEPDADAVPTSIRNNLGLRWCFRVLGQPVNDMALGPGAYRAGWDATSFEDSDKGLCWFIRPDGPPVILRVAFLDDESRDGDELAVVIDRARRLRSAAGTLVGYCAGERFTPTPVDTTPLVQDLVEVRPQGVDKVANAELVGLLQAHKPDKYGGYTTGTLTVCLKELYKDRDDDDLVGPPRFVQVPARKPDGTPTRLKGLDMGWLHAAYAELIDEQEAVPIPDTGTP